MSRRDCNFVKRITRRQMLAVMTLSLLAWSSVLLNGLLTGRITALPHFLIYAFFIASVYSVVWVHVGLYRVRCPQCHWFIGALTVRRSRHLVCRSCQHRFDCDPDPPPTAPSGAPRPRPPATKP